MNKEQLTITATIVCKPGYREQVKQSLLNLIPLTLAEEGCLNYDLHEDNENPDRFFFYENWETRSHWLAHNESLHIIAHRKVAEGAIKEVVIHQLTPVK